MVYFEDEKNPFGLSQIDSSDQEHASYDACASGDTCTAADDGSGGGNNDDD